MEVNFYFYFENTEDRKKFIPVLEKENFKLAYCDISDSHAKIQYVLSVTKDVESEKELDKLDNPTGILEKLVTKFNGEYDGFDRPVGNFDCDE